MTELSSYPSLLRHRARDYGAESDSDSETETLPVVDFQELSPGIIGKASREWGMFRLVNHQVPVELIRDIHTVAGDLFCLPIEAKNAFPTSPILYFWGSPALSTAGTAANANPRSDKLNFLEGFDATYRDLTQEFRYEQDSRLERFKSWLQEYGDHQTRLATAIFRAMAEDLCLVDPSSYLCPATATLRVYRYLRRPTAAEKWGIPTHTDSSVISIIHQDEIGGLQVRRKNKWLHVEPIQDTLIVNVGDMMQGMSGDEYTSVTHRVKLNKERERISLGYFVFPAEDAVIQSSRYRPFTYAEFRASKDSDLMNLGFKVGLPRFRIH